MANCGVCGVDVTFDMMQYYVPDFEGNKHRICKECSAKAQGRALKYDAASGRVIFVERSEIEVRKKCNVCGHVFCYNPVDIDNNKKKQSQALWSAVGSLGGAMSGHYAASAVQQNNSAQAMNGIVDYNKCPKCGSLDLRVIGKEELATGMTYNQMQQHAVPQFSVADELKKFKELLDLGVISQEEFEEKKKEILHGTTNAARQQTEVFSANQTAEMNTQQPNATYNVRYYGDAGKQHSKLPATLFKILAIGGTIVGAIDVLLATEGFQDNYRGALEPIVGHKAYTSAWLAAFFWIVASLSLGFVVGRIAASIQKSRR